jgi:tetratricopeptide (TPR) repeat protein
MNGIWILLFFLSVGLRAATVCDAGDLDLRDAIHSADLYNWHDAEPKFSKARTELSRCHSPSKALLASVGYLRATMEQRNLLELSRQLNGLLSRAPADPLLTMWIYIVKGDIDNDLELPALAKTDWESVKRFARESHNVQWLHRADGELAIPAFYRGDVNTSRLLVTTALEAATASNDYASQLRLLTHIGTVYEMWGQYAAGLSRLDQALAIAHDHPEVGYPVNVQEGRLMGLIGEQKFDQADGLAKEIIAATIEQHRAVNEAQTRVILASLYRKQKRPDQAREQLNRAIAIARSGDYRIALADAEAALADLYASQGDLTNAETHARQALATTRSSGVLSDLPNRMQELASVEAQQGKYQSADALYNQAADLVDAQLLSAPISARPLLLKAMSDVYTGHFALLALHNPDVSKEVSFRQPCVSGNGS